MFNIADFFPSPAPDPRCRYVKVNGARCRGIAKPGSDLCVDHHFKKGYSRGRNRPNPPATFNTVPLVRFAWAEDHEAILFNCNQIAFALVHDTISARQAGALNALMHTAQRSLRQKFLHERFEARERERATQAPNQTSTQVSAQHSSAASPLADRPEDFVTDYVLDTDGMPLALPDTPMPATADSASSESVATPTREPEVSVRAQETTSAPPQAVVTQPIAEPEDRLTIPQPTDSPEATEVRNKESDEAKREDVPEPTPGDTNDETQPEDPHRIQGQRDAILYLRAYYKNDPKMLEEIETYPAARYVPKLKYEPEHPGHVIPALTAAAAPQHNRCRQRHDGKRHGLYYLPATPTPAAHSKEAPSKCPVSHT